MWQKALLVLACFTSACSGRVSEPSGMADPVGPVTFKVRNASQGEVYVRWQQTVPGYDLAQNGTHFDTTHACAPLCTESCACIECSAMPEEVRKIATGETLSFSWTGTWYESISCSSGCNCDHSRSTLAGSYQLTVAAARGFKPAGSVPPSAGTLPGVITGAQLDLSTGACQAQRSVALAAGGQTVELDLTCDK